jgi:hypothetical protein
MKAKSLFDKREGFEIFASLGGSRENAGVLQKYRELASLPSRAEMRHRFSGIPPVEKADFWRVKSVIPLALDRSLSTEQEHFLVKAIYLIKPEFYEIQENSVEWKVLDESLQTFSKQAIELFGRERGNEIFAMCGESTVGVQNAIGDCQCSAISDWCSRNPCSTATSCAQTRGCGTLWVYRCTGLCIGWR